MPSSRRLLGRPAPTSAGPTSDQHQPALAAHRATTATHPHDHATGKTTRQGRTRHLTQALAALTTCYGNPCPLPALYLALACRYGVQGHACTRMALACPCTPYRPVSPALHPGSPALHPYHPQCPDRPQYIRITRSARIARTTFVNSYRRRVEAPRRVAGLVKVDCAPHTHAPPPYTHTHDASTDCPSGTPHAHAASRHCPNAIASRPLYSMLQSPKRPPAHSLRAPTAH